MASPHGLTLSQAELACPLRGHVGAEGGLNGHLAQTAGQSRDQKGATWFHPSSAQPLTPKAPVSAATHLLHTPAQVDL